MSPLRWDVLLLGFVLALPVLAMGLRGDLTTEEVAMRLPWCLAAAWGAVSTEDGKLVWATMRSCRRASPEVWADSPPAHGLSERYGPSR